MSGRLLIDNNESEQDEQANSFSNRKRRLESAPRDYKCPCGKSYLSYPALFTHIKHKHDGRAPGAIIKPASAQHSRRGRPRHNPENNADTAKQTNLPLPVRPYDQTSKILQDIITTVMSFSNGLRFPQMRVLFETSSLYIACCQRFYQEFNSLVTLPENWEKAFVELLWQLARFKQSEPVMNEMTLLLYYMLDFLDNGTEGSEHERPQFGPHQLIMNSNYFILQFQEKYLPKIKAVIGDIPPFFKLQNMIKVVELIFLWLHKKKYSPYWLKINQAFLDYI